MEEFAQILANFGFPIALASYLLFRMEKKIDGFTVAVNTLEDTIKELKEVIYTLESVVTKRQRRK